MSSDEIRRSRRNDYAGLLLEAHGEIHEDAYCA